MARLFIRSLLNCVLFVLLSSSAFGKDRFSVSLAISLEEMRVVRGVIATGFGPEPKELSIESCIFGQCELGKKIKVEEFMEPYEIIDRTIAPTTTRRFIFFFIVLSAQGVDTAEARAQYPHGEMIYSGISFEQIDNKLYPLISAPPEKLPNSYKREPDSYTRSLSELRERIHLGSELRDTIRRAQSATKSDDKAKLWVKVVRPRSERFIDLYDAAGLIPLVVKESERLGCEGITILEPTLALREFQESYNPPEWKGFGSSQRIQLAKAVAAIRTAQSCSQ